LLLCSASSEHTRIKVGDFFWVTAFLAVSAYLSMETFLELTGKKLLLMLWVKKHVHEFFCFVAGGKGPLMTKLASICVCPWESVTL
jgi:hypothetical protein